MSESFSKIAEIYHNFCCLSRCRRFSVRLQKVFCQVAESFLSGCRKFSVRLQKVFCQVTEGV